jgi:hypothetical protein
MDWACAKSQESREGIKERGASSGGARNTRHRSEGVETATLSRPNSRALSHQGALRGIRNMRRGQKNVLSKTR